MEQTGCMHVILVEFWIWHFFSLPMALHITCQYLISTTMFPFWGYQLDGVLFWYLLLTSKVLADAINDLQYRRGKMATMSKMSLQNGLKAWFWEKYKYKARVSRKTAPKMVNSHDPFTSLYKRVFVLSWKLCMAGEQWSSGFVWHQKIMVSKYPPRAVSFIFTLHNLISLNSHCLIIESGFIYFSLAQFCWKLFILIFFSLLFIYINLSIWHVFWPKILWLCNLRNALVSSILLTMRTLDSWA